MIKLHFSLFSLLVFASSGSFAAQWAKVTKEKAIVYADANMTSSIGYITRNKVIRVGEKARNKGRVLPIVVNGKIAYIPVESIQLTLDNSFSSSNTRRFSEAAKKDNFQSKIGLKARAFSTQAIVDDEDSSEDLTFTGFALKNYFEDFNKHRAIALELEYLKGTQDNNTFTMFIINAEYHYRFVHYKGFNLSLFGGVSLAPYTQFESDPYFKVNSTAYGAYVGMEIYSKISSNWGIHLNGGYQYLKATGYSIPESDKVDLPSKFEPSFKGLTLGMAITRVF